MRFLGLIAAAMIFTGPTLVHASATRALSGDTVANTSGGAALAVPSVGTAVVTDTATQTLSGKSISGAANTLTAIPSTALTGQVAVANGGTGSSSLAVGSLVVGNGTSAVSLIAPGTNGYVLTSNGSSWSAAAIPASTPSINGSQASPISITAAGGLLFSGSNYSNTYYIQGSAAAVTVTASPQIVAGTLVGQRVRIIGTSATNTVAFADGSGLSLNGPIVMGTNSALELDWNGSVWTEVSRR